jgi:hypothetical protein
MKINKISIKFVTNSLIFLYVLVHPALAAADRYANETFDMRFFIGSPMKFWNSLDVATQTLFLLLTGGVIFGMLFIIFIGLAKTTSEGALEGNMPTMKGQKRNPFSKQITIISLLFVFFISLAIMNFMWRTYTGT